MNSQNATRQAEEIEALSAIYGDDWVVVSELTKTYSIRVTEQKKVIVLTVTFPSNYPSAAPPKYGMSASWMKQKAKKQLNHRLNSIYMNNVGETVVYQWVEEIREVLHNWRSPKPLKKTVNCIKERSSSSEAEEVEALGAIYGEDWTIESDVTRTYSIKITEKKKDIVLSVTLPEEYPSSSPPKYDLSAPWMDRKAKEQLRSKLNDIYLDNVGENVLYQWVEMIREALHNMQTPEPVRKPVIVEEPLSLSELNISCPEITHGEVIVDRKSIFQGHAAEVHSIEDITAVLNKLKQNKKISNATHNMYAYRIETKTQKGVRVLQDCDDDGEAHAGGRMLHLLQILQQKNTLVVVSRWYGGIQLGPDRFRHINNATRQAIESAGLLNK